MGQLYLPKPEKLSDVVNPVTLRPYQSECLAAIRDSISSGKYRLLIAMATGLGKTVCFAHLPGYLQLPGRWLILAHRQELLEQAAKKLRDINPALHVAIEQADRKAGDADIVVASVPTLQRKRLEALAPDEFAGIVCDEAHHAVAGSYKRIFSHFKLLDKNNTKPLLGFTATPKRGDGLGLSEVFEEITYSYDIRKGIGEGYLSQLAGYKFRTTSNLDNVERNRGEFVQSQLSAEINTEARNQLIVDKYLEYARGRQALTFCAGVKHAHALSAAFEKNGVPSAAIDGETPSSERQSILSRFSDGSLQVVSNCGVLTEGFDEPLVSAILMARPTTSTLLYTQIIGRGTRLANGKDDCLVLDFVDNSSRHSVCNLATLFGLPQDLDPKGKKITKVIEDEEEKEKKKKAEKLEREEKDLQTETSKIKFFDVEIPQEIKKFSSLNWTSPASGMYYLTLGKNNHMSITKAGHPANPGLYEINLYHIKGKISQTLKERSLQTAFETADKLAKDKFPQSLALNSRLASWRKKPASKKQLDLLKRFGFQKEKVTKGEASDIIDKIFSLKQR